MLDRYVAQGHHDALARFKISMSLGPAGPGAGAHIELGAAGVPHPAAPTPAAAGGGLMSRARQFGSGQLGAAKDLLGNLRQGLGGAPDAAAGAAARGQALGNLKTLAPSLLAGGGLYMLHRHNEAKRDDEARQRAMMMGGGGYPQM
jgi:hypothetical protein